MVDHFGSDGVTHSLDETVSMLRDHAASLAARAPGLDASFFSTMVPASPGMSASESDRLARMLGGVAVHVDLRSVLRCYELAGVELAGIVFGTAGTQTMASFFEAQIERPEDYWDGGERSGDALLLGDSAGWVLYADARDGSIRGFEIGRSADTDELVAASLARLLSGLGHLAMAESIERPEAYATVLAVEMKADSSSQFWQQATHGYL